MQKLTPNAKFPELIESLAISVHLISNHRMSYSRSVCSDLMHSTGTHRDFHKSKVPEAFQRCELTPGRMAGSGNDRTSLRTWRPMFSQAKIDLPDTACPITGYQCSVDFRYTMMVLVFPKKLVHITQ
tara:strand:- start:136 stop:516 length:381 start_codon:yes stop_codon:yes gene_type:complete